MVISLSDSHIPLRALRWGHEVWAVTQCSVEKHFSVLEKEIDHLRLVVMPTLTQLNSVA